MIARLSGILVEAAADSAVIDVRGVGYLLLASARTLSALPGTGGEVILLTELQVREDSMTLFGFGSAAEREAWRQLTSVQGVGGRLALAILSILAPDDLSRAVAGGDKASISRASGVGPKLAQRIALELQGKLGLPAALGPGGGIARFTPDGELRERHDVPGAEFVSSVAFAGEDDLLVATAGALLRWRGVGNALLTLPFSPVNGCAVALCWRGVLAAHD